MAALDIFSLDGVRALVTGGSRGLGRAIAEGLLASGADVAVVARHISDDLRSSGLRVVEADVSVPDSAAEIIDGAESELGGSIGVVVHAAGVQHREPAEKFARSNWDHVLATNLTAPFELSQEIGRRQLERSAGGSHIFIGSLASVLSVPETVAYGASKAGILGLARSLSTEWAGRGIRANVVGPGYFRTQLTEAVFTDPARRERMAGRIPMGRFGEPEDLVGVSVFLASKASAYVTGQLIMVDGGWTAS